MMKYMLSQDGLDRVILPSPLSPLTGGLGRAGARQAGQVTSSSQPAQPPSVQCQLARHNFSNVVKTVNIHTDFLQLIKFTCSKIHIPSMLKAKR